MRETHTRGVSRRERPAMRVRLALIVLAGAAVAASARAAEVSMSGIVDLPPPAVDSGVSVERALAERRSVRAYAPGALTLAELGQLLWAAQGVTAPGGLRAAPSAGALYPLELRVAVGEVAGLETGVYQYRPAAHCLERSDPRDLRPDLAAAAHQQAWVSDNAALVVISAQYGRTTGKYGPRGVRYAQLEAGHAAENLFLQATALGIATVVVGAFDDAAVTRLLRLEPGEEPLVLMPLGRPPEGR
jgi:SagB-type dehydrogenase family enzyme